MCHFWLHNDVCVLYVDGSRTMPLSSGDLLAVDLPAVLLGLLAEPRTVPPSRNPCSGGRNSEYASNFYIC